MDMNERILEVIYAALEEVAPLLPDDVTLERSPEATLFGRSGMLDSLGLVNLIVTLEQLLDDEFQVAVTIADEKAMSMAKSPFKTVGSLAEYLSLLLNEQGASEAVENLR